MSDLPRPPLPRRALRVGVVGHRDLGGGDPSALGAALSAVFARLRDAVASARDLPGLDEAGPPRLVVVSALAAGADQRAAEAALELGYELHAPLPFLAEDYARDFDGDPGAAAAFERLRARATRLFEIGEARAGSREGSSGRAYRAVGRLVLSSSDLLVAVWDGEPARGLGGTAEVVAEAAAAGVPVVVLPPGDPSAAQVRVGEERGPTGPASLDALAGLVRRILAPFDPPGGEDAGLSAHDAEALAAQRERLAAFLAERDPAAMAVPRRWLRAPLLAAWRAFVRAVTGAPVSLPAGAPRADAPGPDPLEAHAAWAEALARHYVHLYRGAFLVNYALGAIAVTTALLALLGAARGVHGDLPHALPFVELAALGLIGIVFWRGRTGRWHERGVNYRVLAELFRQQRHLRPLGLSVPATRPRAHLRGEADLTLAWTVAHFRAVARDLGLASRRFAPEILAQERERVLHGWLEGQEAYHRRAAHALGRGERRLERASHALFAGAALACGLHFALAPAWHPLLSAAAAGLPAWGAAIHGVLGQAEWPRLAERSEGMARRLHDLVEGLRSLPPSRLAWRTLADATQDASLAMLLELDDWQALSRAGDVPAP